MRPAYSVLHHFGSGHDGYYPVAGLININGTLYGTTACGGGASYFGGTVFKITPSGKETVLHSVQGGSGGYSLLAGLINVKDALYTRLNSAARAKIAPAT